MGVEFNSTIKVQSQIQLLEVWVLRRKDLLLTNL